MLIYHIVLPEIWKSAKNGPGYSVASLETEGFIHCSYDHQLDGVIGRYYANAPELVILAIDSTRLTSKLVSEPSTGGEEYPHIYGPINLDAVVTAEARTQ